MQQRDFKSVADDRMDALSERVVELERAPEPEEDGSPTDPAAAVVLGALGIGALTWFVRRNR